MSVLMDTAATTDADLMATSRSIMVITTGLLMATTGPIMVISTGLGMVASVMADLVMGVMVMGVMVMAAATAITDSADLHSLI